MDLVAMDLAALSPAWSRFIPHCDARLPQKLRWDVPVRLCNVSHVEPLAVLPRVGVADGLDRASQLG